MFSRIRGAGMRILEEKGGKRPPTTPSFGEDRNGGLNFPAAGIIFNRQAT